MMQFPGDFIDCQRCLWQFTFQFIPGESAIYMQMRLNLDFCQCFCLLFNGISQINFCDVKIVYHHFHYIKLHRKSEWQIWMVAENCLQLCHVALICFCSLHKRSLKALRKKLKEILCLLVVDSRDDVAFKSGELNFFMKKYKIV